ncbi:hypothetical protein OHA40_12415 [Nocardia sp. NBC_00508]|uniref:hypothetical protein n=1 Tax=Nocardia sp. NBC_00508 TaxID=2975992 RepID=UPI002E819E7D|nr:hypothetical protein [Nocardia sp. NBC_00508]WUD68846.1 hypothetical protein OHA40_12415 [Nocardia sp. NBC_00508]
MTDPLADAVPEADLAEQSIPAYPEEPVLPDDAPEENVERVERDVWDANPADVVEQSIPVPLDDELEDEVGY